MNADAKYEKGDLLRWYWEDEKLLGLFLGTKNGKYLIYITSQRDIFFRRASIKRYKDLPSLKVEWKPAFSSEG